MSILRRQVIPTTRSSAKTSSGIVKPATVWAAPPEVKRSVTPLQYDGSACEGRPEHHEAPEEAAALSPR